MNRREFIKILSASAMVPVIGLPAVAPGAPAVGVTVEQATELARMTLRDMTPIKVPWAYCYCNYRYSKWELADIFEKRAWSTLPDSRTRNEKAP